MVGIGRRRGMLRPDRPPIGAKMEFLVLMTEPVEKMAGLERRTAIEPAVFWKAVDAGKPADPQGPADQLDGAHRKAGVPRAEPLGESADDLVVRPALGMGRHHRAAKLQVSVGA